MEHAFGRREPYALGMEEELFLVSPDTHELAHVASELVPRAAVEDGGAVMFDTYEGLVETASPVVISAADGIAYLGQMRDRLREHGATVFGAGLHPSAAFGDVEHVPEERYEAVVEDCRGLVRRTPTAATHVHVGMPDPETAIVVFNRMRAYLPVLQALAAHSPYWHGQDSGLCSARAQMFRALPRSDLPRAFENWDDYVTTLNTLLAAGNLPDYTFLWWDIRPHPKLGTIEVRAMDGQARLASVGGLAALVHALVLHSLEDAPPEELPREALAESSFRAARDGLGSKLWWDGRLQPLAVIAEDVLARARPYARETGADGLLDEVERILREGNGADQMRAAHARGGMDEVLSWLVRTAAEPV